MKSLKRSRKNAQQERGPTAVIQCNYFVQGDMSGIYGIALSSFSREVLQYLVPALLAGMCHIRDSYASPKQVFKDVYI